jgi:CheY-like chemotaxis protein
MSLPRPELLASSVPSVVVVDPQFDAYKPLAASARLGKISLHFRSSGAEAVKLARRLRVNAWLIASELDDMSGHDLVPLLQSQLAAHGCGDAKLAVIEAVPAGSRQWNVAAGDARAAGADSLLSHPITSRDLEALLGLQTAERAEIVSAGGPARAVFTLPVGVGAAAIAIAVLMMG